MAHNLVLLTIRKYSRTVYEEKLNAKQISSWKFINTG